MSSSALLFFLSFFLLRLNLNIIKTTKMSLLFDVDLGKAPEFTHVFSINVAEKRMLRWMSTKTRR